MPRRKPKKPFTLPEDSAPEKPKYTFLDLADSIAAFDVAKTREILESNPDLVHQRTAEGYTALDVFVITYDMNRQSLELVSEILMILHEKGFNFEEKSPNGFYPIDFLISKNHGVLAAFLKEFGAKLDHKVTAVDFDYQKGEFIFSWDERFDRRIRNKYIDQFIAEEFSNSEDIRLMQAYLELEPYAPASRYGKSVPWIQPSLPPISTGLPDGFKTQIDASSIKPEKAFVIESDATINGTLKEYCTIILARGISVECNAMALGKIFVSDDDSYDSFGKPRPVLHVPKDEASSYVCDDGSVEIVGDLPSSVD